MFANLKSETICLNLRPYVMCCPDIWYICEGFKWPNDNCPIPSTLWMRSSSSTILLIMGIQGTVAAYLWGAGFSSLLVLWIIKNNNNNKPPTSHMNEESPHPLSSKKAASGQHLVVHSSLVQPMRPCMACGSSSPYCEYMWSINCCLLHLSNVWCFLCVTMWPSP